ncbi:MAG: RodZ domain-containing protein [Pseudomonadota bacterium]
MLGRRSHPKTEEPVEEKRGFDAFDLRLGDIMRGERATMGKSLLDVQRELKIKATYIAAVENADPSVFETPGFIAGYVRSYARFLGLDPEWAFQRFCAESGFTGVEGLSANKATTSKAKSASAAIRKPSEDAIIRPNAPYAPMGEGLLSRIEPGAIGSVSVMVALIGILGYGGWTVLQEIQRVDFAPVEQTPGIVAEVDNLQIAPTESDTGSTTAAFAAPSADALDRLYRPQALEAPVLTARDGPIAALDPNANGALVGTISTPSAPAALALTAVDAPATPQVVETATPDVVLFAVRPAWVRVASADGTILFEKILDAGEQYVLPQSDEPPLLRAGNSGSLYFNVQGKTFGPAGPGTSVAKNVALGVEAITTAYVEADLDADPVLSDVLTAMAATPAAGSDASPLIAE